MKIKGREGEREWKGRRGRDGKVATIKGWERDLGKWKSEKKYCHKIKDISQQID